MAGPQQLEGSEWRPIEIAGEVMPADTPLFIRFEADRKVAGHGGCNRMFGSYTHDKAALRIGPLATTRKACQSHIMKNETAFVKALEATRVFVRDATKLTLKDGQGQTTLRLVQSDWD